jgi:hypothetical protein
VSATGVPGPLKRFGLRAKKWATFVYGPAELPRDIDPVKRIDDEELGQTPTSELPPKPPVRSERQKSYDELPKGTAE